MAKNTNEFADDVSDSVRDRTFVQKDGPKSPELRSLTNKFLAFHGASYACNMATIATSIYYAMCIMGRCL